MHVDIVLNATGDDGLSAAGQRHRAGGAALGIDQAVESCGLI